ncbi:MAG: glycosyltransferase family 2 protein [Phycisphaeraceae bacterium]|nr:glycosyltransferase family 2 protein [Phycisphaeraceae bacterium]
MHHAVIVTTYNRPDALGAVLAGLLVQRGAPSFEVHVADDGSGEATRRLVDSFAPRFEGRLHHVWHPDEGFRAGAIRNRAAAGSSADRLIFLDGDCIPRPHFVAGHAAAATQGTLARGSRALLTQAFSERVLRDSLPVHTWGGLAWLRARLRGDVNRWRGLAHTPWSMAAGPSSSEWRSVRSCNLAIWRSDFERVNGFDERFVGWGYEDSDLAIRLINAGVRVRRAGGATTVLHLWHHEHDRRFEGENLERLEATRKRGTTRAEIGLSEAAVRGVHA